MEDIMDTVCFNKEGLVPVIAQQFDTSEVLMMAWMNREALEESLRTRRMCYWSRSRGSLWRKGESSGQLQFLKAMMVDCDGDTLLAKVDQQGVACHTGRKSCFFRTMEGDELVINQEVLVAPETLYGEKV